MTAPLGSARPAPRPGRWPAGRPRAVLAALLALLVVVATLPGPARAQGRDEAARKVLKQGNALYRQGRFEEALRLYQEAHAIQPGPKTIFNMAQTHRRLGHRALALKYYRQFLELWPTAPNAGEVRKHIAALEQAAPPPSPPVLPAAPAAPSPPMLPAPPVPPPVVITPERVSVVRKGDDRPPSLPWYQRWYIWATVGAVVAAGVVAAVVAGTRDPYNGKQHAVFQF